MAVTSIQGFRVLPLSIAQLNLSAVLKCGQSFRWQSIALSSEPSTSSTVAPDREWRLALQDRVICLRQTPETLYYRAFYPEGIQESEEHHASTLEWLHDYFQLEIDLEKLYDEWSIKDPVFKRLRDRFCGIRMLRQEPWENVVSFICSQNNHISRITNMVQSLCTHFSPPLVTVTTDGVPTTYHPFPPPEVLRDPTVEGTLRGLGFGYRAKYIQKTADLLCQKDKLPKSWLLALRQKSVSEAREALLEFSGIGPKVADCILLMSMDKACVVPVDTHVYQIAVKHYGLRGSSGKPNMTPLLYAQVAGKLTKVWGDYAGWAHSVLFTADLKSFATYGLPASRSPSVSSTVVAESPSTTPRKRKSDALLSSPLKKVASMSAAVVATGVLPTVEEAEVLPEALTLAERIKARKRLKVTRQ